MAWATPKGPSWAVHDNPQIEALAHERFVESFLEQSPRSQATLLPTSALIAFLWARGAGLAEPAGQAASSGVSGGFSGGFSGSLGWPALWMLAVALMVWWRYRYTATYVRHSDPRQSTRRIAQVLFAAGVLNAVPTLGFPVMDDFARAVLTMTLMVVATVSVITTSGFRNVFMAFAAPQVLAAAVAWAWVGWERQDLAHAGLALSILVYLSFLRGVGQHAHAVFIEGCAYRFGEQQLNRELQQALGAADEAVRAKTQFLAAASHDLRQPIHSMNVLVAALSLRTLDTPTREIVNLLGSVNQILSKQLDTLLDMSKLDAGIVRAELSPQRLDLIARAHHAAMTPVAAQRGLRMELVTGPALWVHTDAALLTRALSNLTDNAIKYTPHGGVIRLVAQHQGADAVLVVSDSGIGIPVAEQELVFGEFYQVANIERDRSKGLGLGLSIVRRLCALLQVKLSLVSLPGQGTTVSLRLPQVAPGQSDTPSLAGLDEPRGLRVLVVDDEAMVRDSMRLLLVALGCTVHTAEGVADAVELARLHRFDALLSDLRLRGGDSGLAAIAAVRELQPQVHAVLVTGDTAPDRMRDAKAAGVPLLFKPVTLEQLLAVLPQAAPRQGDGAPG